MFSFIKYLQGLKEVFQKNKGLWFTTMTLLSILGITSTMYIMTTMTSDVSKKVYKSMAKEYNLKVISFLDSKREEFKKIAVVISQNELLVEFLQKNDEEKITKITKNINDQFVKQKIHHFNVSLYAVGANKAIVRPSIISVIKSKNIIYGIEVMSDGVFNTYLQPLIKDGAVYGVIEIKESIHNSKSYFDETNNEFVFLLDKKMLPKISIAAKNGSYRDIINDYTVEQTFYDSKFLATVPELGKESFKELIDNNYFIDDTFYRTYKIINDINGAEIGMLLLGEQVDNEEGFVHLADNMTKTVTTVSLGLVMSIMLFMF